MSERLIEQRKSPSQLPMAARAIGICEGCPVAQFCVVKAVAPCETPAVKEMHIDAAGGGYDGSTLDKPVQMSYRKELKDDGIDIVMANMQKAKELQSIRAMPTERAVKSVTQPRKNIDKPKVSSSTSTPIAVKPKSKERSESEADLIAGIFMSMIGVKGIATARAQKSV